MTAMLVDVENQSPIAKTALSPWIP